MCLSRGSSATYYLSRYSPPLFPSLSEPYHHHPSWRIPTWRSRSMSEHSDSSLYTLTDLFLPAVETLKPKPKGKSMQPTRTLLWAPGTGKQRSSTLCSALAASLPDSTHSRSMARQNSASRDDLRESQRPGPLVPNGSQDHEGIPKGDGNGEPGGHPADG